MTQKNECTAAQLPDQLQPLAEEICTYFRELPRLLKDGQEGRVALIRGGELISIWDTFEAALRAGYDTFGMDRFMAQPIKKKDADDLAGLFVVQRERSSA